MRNIKAGGEIGRSEREEGQCSRYNSTAIVRCDASGTEFDFDMGVMIRDGMCTFGTVGVQREPSV